MFVYGVCIGTEAKHQQFAVPGLATWAPGSPVIERRRQVSIFQAFNSILDEVRSMSVVDELVLLHEDVELRAPVEEVLRCEFTDPSVAVVGAIGGRGVRSVRWSRSAETFGRAPDAFYGENDHGGGEHDVDIVDGLFLALSPWAIENLGFDEEFSGFHAYDANIGMQARAQGRRVRVVELDLFHYTKGCVGDVSLHRASDDRFRREWAVRRDGVRHRVASRLHGRPY